MGLFDKIKNVFSKDKEAVKYEEGLTKTRKEFSTELSSLSKKYKNIDDNYPKYVISTDTFDMSQNGIIHKNIIDWLLNR